jgi:hypothetical protein
VGRSVDVRVGYVVFRPHWMMRPQVLLRPGHAPMNGPHDRVQPALMMIDHGTNSEVRQDDRFHQGGQDEAV